MKQKVAVINAIWLWLIIAAVLVGMAGGRLEAVSQASFDSVKDAVNLAISLIGVMALWLGLMKIAEAGGLMRILSRAIKPVMVRLFPEVPAEHPAMAAMIMNIAANMLGLGNAATPMGIKAMIELNTLNRHPGRATDAMCLFLAINTSSVTILPLGVIGVRAAAGAADPAGIMIPSIIATACSTLTAIVAARLLAKRAARVEQSEALPPAADVENTQADTMPVTGTPVEDLVAPAGAGRILMLTALASVVLIFVIRLLVEGDAAGLGREFMRHWIIPLIIMMILAFGYLRGVKVYEVATEGAKEGFQVAIRIIPFLIMILAAIAMFKASGAFGIVADLLSPLTDLMGIPVEVLPVALMRPLSGSGSFGAMSALVQSDPDSLASFMAGIMQGSTETTFYVLAVYFGAAGITKVRYAIAAALLADFAGLASSVLLAHLFYGG